MAYPFLARNVFGRTIGMEGLGAHGIDGLVVSSRHFGYVMCNPKNERYNNIQELK